ncbi:MAG: carbamoyltransferase N-terminal domain-containing protein [Phycisphaerae bacterium]
MTAILGISAFYHDSAAALVADGKIVAAAQEERFTRKKHDSGFPVRAIEYCLSEAGVEPGDLDYVGFYDKPWLKFERLLETYLAYAPQGLKSFMQAMPLWLRQKLHLPREISRGLKGAFRKRCVFAQHHESHAASAFFPSPFEEAAILTLDGVGEWATAGYGYGRGNRITLTHELHFPHSLGLLYSAFTYFTGFSVNSGEYKLMGLAPYGEPKYVDRILEHLVDLKDDGSFRMDMSYFNYCQGLTMTNRKFDRLFGGPPRTPESPITRREMDIAASVQKVTEEIVLRMARHVHAETGMKNLCLAGGVALNCVANGRVLREGPFEDLWVQPAAGDAGGALGIAQFIWYQLLGNPRTPTQTDDQRGSLLGPSFTDDEIQGFLDTVDAAYTRVKSDEALCDLAADYIASGKVVGWFQGPMEFGPRALGSRSILADARDGNMQRVINMKVKFREGFRPFAPSVLRERAAEYFEVESNRDSAYMLLVAPVRDEKRSKLSEAEARTCGLEKLNAKRSVIPAVTHVDCSARLQTVDAERHGSYQRLVDTFHRKTGCPVVVNTSFNLGWDPIVATPHDAYDTFMSCDLDVLCMGHFVLTKTAQRAWVSDAEHGVPQQGFEDMLCSPCCQAVIEHCDGKYVCDRCRHEFPVENGIPLMFRPHESFDDTSDVTEKVKAFYEQTPFPNYDDHETLRSLIDKSRRGLYAKMLDDAIPYNSTVLEVGCGTGQLSNFLGISCRRVVATDLCVNSLRLGEAFREEHGLSRVRFLQMNLFRPCFRSERFDVILCNGVLHHTSDPYGGLRHLVPLLKPGGYIVVGLYNRYGRLATDLRRTVLRLSGGRGRWLDPYMRSSRISEEKEEAWLADQYRHPHESKHTIGEVLDWFNGCGLRFVRGIPSVSANSHGIRNGSLFEATPPGSGLDHALAQLKQVFTGSREGGFFVMIGRRP